MQTLFFSLDTASVAAIIPVMDHIMNCLNQQTGMTYHPSLIAAMKLVSKKMDRYYLLTNSLPVYRIAMVLHPGMKLEYFCNHNWEAKWIEEAERLVRTKYVEQYEQQADEAPTMPSTNSITHHNSGFALFGDLSVTTAPHASEIQEYLSHPVENVKDPLK